MRRYLLAVVVFLVAVPILLAGVDRSGGQMWFIKQYGTNNVLYYSSLRNGVQLVSQMNYGDPGLEMIYQTRRGELVVSDGREEKCVVLENNAQGTNRVILWNCSGNAQWNEQWRLIPQTGQIKHVNHGGCLEASGGKAIIAACSGKDSQRWFWQKAGGTSYGRR